MAFFPASNIPPARRRSPRTSCAGLDIGRDRVRLALLGRRRERLQLELLAEYVFPAAVSAGGQIGDFELLAQGCRQLLRAHAVAACGIAIGMPLAGTTATRLTLPAASGRLQRLAQVRAELAARGLPPDELALDYRVLGPTPASPADVQVLAVAAPTIMVEDRLALADALALELRALPAAGWCAANFLRGGTGAEADAVLHLDAAAAWLSRRPDECLPLQWQASGSSTELLRELAPLLRTAPRRLLLSGDCADLASIVGALRKYAGIAADVATLPARIRLPDTFAAFAPRLDLPAFHCALALAAEGLA